VAIGAWSNDGSGKDAGHVRIYKNISGTWTQQGSDIDGEAAGDGSGYSVSLSSDGSIVAIGAYANDGNGTDAGHVKVYKNMGGTWTQQGSDIDGEAANDNSGWSVSLSSDGSTVAIGAPLNDGNGNAAGHVRIYKNISGTWTQQGSDIDGEAVVDYSGNSVSLSSDGSTVAIGANYNDGNGAGGLQGDVGHVRVYKNISGTWTQVGSDIDGETLRDKSGSSVSLSSDGSTVAIGAAGNDGNGSSAGQVRIYKDSSGTWTQEGLDIDGEAAGDRSGCSVSLSSDGRTVAIGAWGNDGSGSTSGHVRAYSCTKDMSSDTITACDSCTWTDGITYTKSNTTAKDTFVNTTGCDSIVTLNLTINYSDASTDAITACDSYTWTDGITYTKSNTTAKDTFVNTTGCDSIVTLNLTINYSTASTDAITACDSYTWTNGITYTQSNTTAKDTFVNTTGCDSIVTLDLTINYSDFISQQPTDQSLLISQDATFDIGTSGTPSLTFQWQTDIGTGYQKMSNAGQYSGTQTKNLSISNVTSANNNQKFRCIVNDQYCSDTSVAALLSLYGLSVDNLRNNQIFHIYPNPASDELNIKIESNLLGSQFRIINTLGQEVRQGELSNLNSTIDISKLPKGSYTMLIGTENYSHPFLVE
jgi:hypothetical protein